MKSQLKTLALEDFEALKKDAQLIEQDEHGEKVLLLPNGNYFKLFRRKRLISSASWYPYAQRFVDNAGALAERGIPCPKVVDLFRIPAIARDLVHYEPLPGITLRKLMKQHVDEDSVCALRRDFNQLVRRLHDGGIYFRSLHLNNVVLTPEGELGLIDISDIRVHRKPLSRFWRKRNLRRMEGIPGERDWLDHGYLLGNRDQPAVS